MPKKNLFKIISTLICIYFTNQNLWGQSTPNDFTPGLPPTAVSPVGAAVLEHIQTSSTNRNYLQIKFIDATAEVIYDELKYGIEIFSHRPQQLRQVIVGKNIYCSILTNSFCEIYLNKTNQELYQPLVQSNPINTVSVGQIQRLTTRKGAVDLKGISEAFSVKITGSAADALYQSISGTEKSLREFNDHEFGQYEKLKFNRGTYVKNKHMICYKNVRYTKLEPYLLHDLDGNPVTAQLETNGSYVNYCRTVISLTDGKISFNFDDVIVYNILNWSGPIENIGIWLQ